ncbi:MAG: hypothetical protein JOZ48_09660 [Acidobacteriaceae bacterium]|nr:hypothetical protein [Acidobacteriaceae bacterium]
MHRVLAILLLSAVQLPLIAPVFRADMEAQAPACCRLMGKHKCMMKRALRIRQGARSGASIASLDDRCPFFPEPATTAPGAAAGVIPSRAPVAGILQTHATKLLQTEARFRISFSRVRQKRGPPSIVV